MTTCQPAPSFTYLSGRLQRHALELCGELTCDRVRCVVWCYNGVIVLQGRPQAAGLNHLRAEQCTEGGFCVLKAGIMIVRYMLTVAAATHAELMIIYIGFALTL